ncbi:hypothetical protein ABLE68_20045 [Nocardioides sp. CN2-186]|uniref:hypothetical protein n=1 Tax=Nocardioides tweenelious TaxID=3156607 RepID=UPI0032B430E8
MAYRSDRVCVPMEIEIIPLYRDSPEMTRFLRDQRRQRRRAFLARLTRWRR